MGCVWGTGKRRALLEEKDEGWVCCWVCGVVGWLGNAHNRRRPSRPLPLDHGLRLVREVEGGGRGDDVHAGRQARRLRTCPGPLFCSLAPKLRGSTGRKLDLPPLSLHTHAPMHPPIHQHC